MLVETKKREAEAAEILQRKTATTIHGS